MTNATLEGAKLNINAVGCYGLVRSKGKIGIDFELINGISVEDEMTNGAASLKFFGIKMAGDLKLIHSQTANSKIYPEAKNFYLDCAEKCVHGKWLTADEGVKIKKFIEALPVGNSLIYYHLMNVFMICQLQLFICTSSRCVLKVLWCLRRKILPAELHAGLSLLKLILNLKLKIVQEPKELTSRI